MPIYFLEDTRGESQPLYVHHGWPERGRYPFLKGAGRDKPWGEVRYKSMDDVLAVDFDEFDGLFSTGFFGCNALIYVYPDNTGGFAGAVMYHVPSGVLSSIKGSHGAHGPTHPPQEYREKLVSLGGSPGNVWVVIVIWATNHESNVAEQAGFCKEDGVPDERIKVILVEDQGFTVGIRYDGSLGQCAGAPRAVTRSTAKVKKQKGCCYLSTAACEARGLSDDCAELQVLRRFRDEVLMHHPRGRRLISRYYEVAPDVVARIERLREKRAVYEWIYGAYVIPGVEAATRRDLEGGMAILEAVLGLNERLVS